MAISYKEFPLLDFGVVWDDLTENNGNPNNIGSYGGQNPECVITSELCSKNMAPNNSCSTGNPRICYWHLHRTSHVYQDNCDCKTHYVVGGDSTSRRFFFEYCEKMNIDPPKAVSDFQLYCCAGYRSYGPDSDGRHGTCGEMQVCPNCKDEHKHFIANDDNE